MACDSVADQVSAGNSAIGGVLIESFLVAGNQHLEPGEALGLEDKDFEKVSPKWPTSSTAVAPLSRRHPLRTLFLKEVTDSCLDFNMTQAAKESDTA